MVNIKAFIIYIEAYDRSQKLIDSLGEIGVPHEKVLSLSRFKDEETLAMVIFNKTRGTLLGEQQNDVVLKSKDKINIQPSITSKEEAQLYKNSVI